MEALERIFESTGVVPVIKLESAEQAVPLGKALLAGGIAAAEVTFRTPAAAGAIAAITEALPELFVCAGTVLTVEQAKLAASCGAKAVVSPGTNPRVVDWCQSHDLPVCPGCATPTEIEACLGMGLTFLKLFPAQAVGGVPLLKALYGPYQNVKFMPTGGISPANLKDYLSLPNVLACGGSWLCPEQAVAEGNWEEITRLAAQCAQLVKAIHSEAGKAVR